MSALLIYRKSKSTLRTHCFKEKKVLAKSIQQKDILKFGKRFTSAMKRFIGKLYVILIAKFIRHSQWIYLYFVIKNGYQ